ncbi:hypothetical protein BDV12DRAFT_103886 [Aspergillus spectabilis]
MVSIGGPAPCQLLKKIGPVTSSMTTYGPLRPFLQLLLFFLLIVDRGETGLLRKEVGGIHNGLLQGVQGVGLGREHLTLGLKGLCGCGCGRRSGV